MVRTLIAAAAVAGLAAAPALADDMDALPKNQTWTAYGTNASGYAMAVGIGNALSDAYGVNFRVIPGENDIARMAPLRDGLAQLCACGIASYFGSEGVLLFADPDWGPQPIRIIMTSRGTFGLQAVVAGDIGVEEMSDLAGKRIPWVVGGDALNLGMEAMMAFGGVTWDDVTKVEVPGNKQMFEAMLANQADAAFTSTVNPATAQVAASPRGILWPSMPADDAEGWARVKDVAPYFAPVDVTRGNEIDADDPIPGAGYPYPILAINSSMEDDAAYAMAKALVEQFDNYKDSNPGALGFDLEAQNFAWAIPYHDGAVRYFKEIGVWTDEHQAHNDGLVDRQNLIIATWEEFMAGDTPSDKDEFRTAWLAARAEALEGAGLSPVFR